MSALTQNLSDKDKKFLKTMKDQGIDAKTALDRLSNVKAKIGGSQQQDKGTFGFGKPPLPQTSSSPQAQQKPSPSNPLFNALLGATGPNLIKGLANPATLQGNSGFQKGLNNFNSQGIASATDALANTAGFVAESPMSQLISKKTGKPTLTQEIQNKSKEITNPIRDQSYQRNETTPDSLSSIAGDITGNIVGSLPAIYGGGALTKGLGLESQALKSAPKLMKAGAFLGRSGLNTAATTVPTQGRLPNAQELTTGAGIDAAFGLVGHVADKGGNYLYNKIIPSTPTQLASDIRKGIDIGESLSKDGISATRKSAMNKASQRIKNLSGLLDEKIAAIDNTAGLVKMGKQGAVPANQLVENLKEEVLKSPKLKAQFGDTKAIHKAIDNVVNEFNSVVGKDKNLTYAELQNLKKKLGGGLGSFFDKADNAAKAKDIANEVIRKRAQGLIEKAIPEAKNINKQLAPLLVATERSAKKGPSRGLLQDLIAGTGFAGYQGATGQANSPEDYVKNVILGGLVRRAGRSTFAKTSAGTVLKDISRSAPILQQLSKLLLLNKKD
jgi:hypothetical protein